MTHQYTRPYSCTCECGHSRFSVHSEPLARFFCHCTICQRLYHKPFADVTVVRAKNVSLSVDNDIVFRKYRYPPAVNRGTCQSCGLPVVGFFSPVPFLNFAFIPSHNFADTDNLAAPESHIFYHRRVDTIEDELPKYAGFWSSQLAASKLLLSTLL